MALADAIRIIRNAPYRHSFAFMNASNQPITDDLVANAAGYLVTDAGTPGSPTITPGAGVNAAYTVDLSAVQMSSTTIFFYAICDTGGHATYIRPEPCLDSGVAGNAGTSTLFLASTASSTNDLYNGATIEIARGAGVGQVRTIVDYSGSGKEVTVDRPWATEPTSAVYVIKSHGTPLEQDSATMRAQANVLQINSDSTAAQNLELLYEGAFITSTVNDATASNTAFIGTAADLEAVDDFYNDMLVVFTSGDYKGVPRKVEDYDGTGTQYQFTITALPDSDGPDDGDTFILIALIA